MVKGILLTGLVSCLLLFLLLQSFSFEFSAIGFNLFRTKLAYFITQSGGPIGTTVGIFVACFLYTLNETGFKNKISVFGKALTGLVLIIGLFAAVNEKLTKPILKLQRPSHVYMLNQMQTPNLIDSLYQLSKDERIAFFNLKVNEQAMAFQKIDPKVLNHWVAEGGYSFPSGHTFNAFLLAMIFAFGIRHNNYKSMLQKLYQLPFVWAITIGISRVALGAHSWMDVCAGALMGVGIGGLLLYLDFTRHWVTHRKWKVKNEK